MNLKKSVTDHDSLSANTNKRIVYILSFKKKKRLESFLRPGSMLNSLTRILILYYNYESSELFN